MAQFPDLIEAIPLPNKTDGYQRPGMAMMAGTTAANANPNGTNAPFAVQLFSRAMGHLGGNNITAEFKNPGANDSPLSITVTDGTWRDYDPNDADASNGITEISVPTKDIVVNLATDATGAHHHHGGAADRRDQRRSGRERAGAGVHATPATRARASSRRRRRGPTRS